MTGRRSPMRALHGVLASVAAALVLPVATVAAGTGLLYLLYRHGALAAGPAVPGALSLETLVGHGSQPLARTACAWASAGIGAGALLAAIGRLRPPVAVGAFAAGTAITVIVAGAATRALVHNQPLGPQVVPQLHSSAAALAWGVAVATAAAVTVVHARATPR